MCLMIAILSCDNDAVNMKGVDASKEYFPLHVGRYIEYQVDSIVFDDAPGGNTKDTATFSATSLLKGGWIQDQVIPFILSIALDVMINLNHGC